MFFMKILLARPGVAKYNLVPVIFWHYWENGHFEQNQVIAQTLPILRSIMFGTSKYLQYKTQSQNNWKHILTFREATSHIVKSNEWRKTQSTSI